MNIEEIVNKKATKLRIKHQFNELTELECKTFLNEFLEAINYSQCCKSDSEQFSFADMRDAFDYASVSSQRRDGYTFKEWISKR
jgi:hypothetical protein